MEAAPVTSSHPPVQVWWSLRAIKSALLHEQFLLITLTQPTVANDPITSVVPPFLSAPPPSSLLFAPPFSSSSSSVSGLSSSVEAALPLLMSAAGHTQKAPRTLGKPLNICLRVCLDFCLLVAVSIRVCYPFLVSLTVHSSLSTAELMSLISTWEKWIGFAPKLNELRQSERHQLTPSQFPPLWTSPPILAWSNSPRGALWKTTLVISCDRGSRKSS